MYQLKWEYNNTLNRYYNGCNYIEEHIEDESKYLPAVLDLLNKINILLKKIQEKQTVTEEEILGGFELCQKLTKNSYKVLII